MHKHKKYNNKKIAYLFLLSLFLSLSLKGKAPFPCPVITVTGNVISNVSCNGYADGSATSTASGGIAPYTYLWNPGSKTTDTITGLSAGTYTITITDHNGCTGTATVTITQPLALNASTTSTTSTCGDSNGTATVLVTGGTSPYTYLWANGQSTSTATGLSAGTYLVSITDSNGCNINASVTVSSSSPITTSISSKINVKCNGSCDGSATVSASGGAHPYTYLWSPTGQTNATATGLCAGIYNVTVTDNNGCFTPALVDITQPPAIRDSVSAISYPTCNGGTGSATVGVKDGTPPYTYSWSPNGGTNSSATGLSAGTYVVTITDNNNCVKTLSITITQPPLLVANPSIIPTTCGNNNGSASANASGGTAPYTYLWSPGGQTTDTITGLSLGTYTITVTDFNNCTATATATITPIPPPTVTISSFSNDKCNNDNTGSATSSVSGGTAPYTYLWSPSGGSSASATGLSTGTYTITITDNKGCTATASVTITQPPAIIGSISTTGVLCNGGNTGTVNITVNGGTPPYTYLWSPGGQTKDTATNLTAGCYTVTITDANGCTNTFSACVTQPPAIRDSVTAITYPICNGGTGSATVGVKGGTPPYTYSWSPNGGSNDSATGLSAGTYVLTITDSNNCNKTLSVTITQPPPVVVSATVTPTSCGNNNGSAIASASGGFSPYTYLWGPPGNQTTSMITGLSVGTYSVTITDSNGCSGTGTAIITAIATPTVTISSVSNDKCNGDCNGSATASVSGGTAPFAYLWSPGGQTSATATGLCINTYTVNVTDNNGCTTSTSVTITQPTPLTSAITDTNNVKCNGICDGSATVTANGGTSPYAYAWSPGGQTNATATGLCINTYVVTVTDNNSCTSTASVTITQPPLLTAAITSVTDLKCNGDSSGIATVTASGGVSPYTYLWNPTGLTVPTATGLKAGTYTVTVTDSNGCSKTASVNITQPSQLTAPVTTLTNVSCNGDSNGVISLTPGGGNPPYTYLWLPAGQTTSSITGLSAGMYTVTVTDFNNCSLTTSITISQPPVLTTAVSSTLSECSANNGTATVTAGGGISPYTYSWSPSSETTTTATGLSSGVYTVTVTDNNGCNMVDTIRVHNSSSLTISASNTNVLCNGASNGTATVITTGGVSPFTYSWMPLGETSSTVTGLSAGTYTVTVTDNTGCIQFIVVTITQPPILSLTTSSTGSGCANNSGSATVTTSGGTGPYSYSWAPPGQNNAADTGLSAGTYTITVTDQNGCTGTASAVVTQPLAVTITPSQKICLGQTVILVATGGGQYLWSTGSTDDSILVSPTSETNYSVMVVSNGCTDSAHTSVVIDSLYLSACCNTSIEIGDSVNLTSNGGDILKYEWAPSTGLNCENCADVIANPTVTTTYTVTGTDSLGCTIEKIVIVTIEIPCSDISIPNVFTPGNAGTLGLDDKFYINTQNSNPTSWSLVIYDRWGKEMFKSTNPTQYWNGNTESGDHASTGIYYYIINAICQGSSFKKEGFVQLIR